MEIRIMGSTWVGFQNHFKPVILEISVLGAIMKSISYFPQDSVAKA